MARPRPRKWFRRERWKQYALGGVVAVAIGIAGFHSHGHVHGDLRVIDADGNVRLVPQWRFTGEDAGLALEPIPAGEFRFELQNADGIPHDFVVMRSDVPASSLPVDNGRVSLESAGQLVGAITAVDPGGKGTSETMVLEPGNYILFCNVPGHYSGGMYYTLEVK